jgi:serpin B
MSAMRNTKTIELRPIGDVIRCYKDMAMKKLSRILPLCGAAAFVVHAQNASADSAPTPIKPVASEVNPDSIKPMASSAFIAGNTAFGLAMYRRLAKKADNVSIAPFSISQALAMTSAGAKGKTAKEMQKALQFPDENIHAGFAALSDALQSRAAAVAARKGDTPFQLTITNSLWVEKTNPLESGFLATLANDYKSPLQPADFKGNAAAERMRINTWVEKVTNQKIKDLLPAGSVSAATRAVLVNAVYFKTNWADAFMVAATKPLPFHVAEKKDVQVPMMQGGSLSKLVDGPQYTAFAKPYVGGQVEFVAIMPKGSMADFEKNLNATTFNAAYQAMTTSDARLTMPKFRVAGEVVDLIPSLQALGMKLAFTGAADFTAMDKTTGPQSIRIGAVLHKTFIAVDESGTEAAGATAVVMMPSGPPRNKTVTIDRPFIFAIRDIPTGTLLFVGKIVDPSK